MELRDFWKSYNILQCVKNIAAFWDEDIIELEARVQEKTIESQEITSSTLTKNLH